MLPVLLIHGYSSEGKDATVDKIYGTLRDELTNKLGASSVKELDLSRWISLSDGISLDDVSLAMDRALRTDHADLLTSGFHVIIHSTGALVCRNWIKKFSPKPSPIQNLIHLAGANFGSGLAHIGQGQLARWGRHLAVGTGCGFRILTELEFGCWKTLDLHLHFLQESSRMVQDYQVQEFCIIGSQIPDLFRVAPIRYIKEDSSDCTVRTSGGNLNFNYLAIRPTADALTLPHSKLTGLVEQRLSGRRVTGSGRYYQIERAVLSGDGTVPEIPFSIPYEIAHSGAEIGIVTGKKNRAGLLSLIQQALKTPLDPQLYAAAAQSFRPEQEQAFEKVTTLSASLTEWNPQEQYEGHAQLIFRIRDQQGLPVEHFDVFLNSADQPKTVKLESMIEDKHCNKRDPGTITFYLRTQQFNKRSKTWQERLKTVAPLSLEITGEEPSASEITYLPLSLNLTTGQIQSMVKTFQTTVIDVVLVRLPSPDVFTIVENP